jgi:hypothetical protein
VTAADLLGKLSLEATERLAGTPLEHDLDKLEQLGRVVPEEQAAAVRRHLSFEIPWEAAFEGLTLRSNGDAVTSDRAVPQSEPVQGPRRIERRKVTSLKPNRFNAALFPDSLADTSIAVIAEDLQRNGQRTAIEITPDGTVIDGERRWRGATQLGWDDVEVLVGPELTDDEILDRVLDSCTSSRRMTVREQVNVFTAVTDQLQREAGRQQGRPSEKTMPDGIIFLTPADIRDAAARRAGFSSTKQAIRAEAVFTRGSTEQQADVLDGSLTVTAAYEALPKRPKKKGTASTPGESQSNLDAADGYLGASEDDDEPRPPLEASDVRAAAPSDDDELRDDGEGAASLTSEPEEETERTPEGEEAEPADRGLDVDEDEEQEAPDVSFHVNAICTHITNLAEHDYDEAAIWLGDLVEQMRTSLGERSDFDDVEGLNASLDNFDVLRDL